jgi:hypothetical protein
MKEIFSILKGLTLVVRPLIYHYLALFAAANAAS